MNALDRSRVDADVSDLTSCDESDLFDREGIAVEEQRMLCH